MQHLNPIADTCHVITSFPRSSNVFDSLGEAYNRANKHDDARKACLRAVELDPANANAGEMLQKLK